VFTFRGLFAGLLSAAVGFGRKGRRLEVSRTVGRLTALKSNCAYVKGLRSAAGLMTLN
jgi:hypothetical protein